MSENRQALGKQDFSLRQQARFGYITLEAYHAELSDRNSAWSRLSPSEQLAALDRRLGKDVGAKRQRAIIAARLTKPAEPVTVAPNGGNPGAGLTDTKEVFASKSEEKRVKAMRKHSRHANGVKA